MLSLPGHVCRLSALVTGLLLAGPACGGTTNKAQERLFGADTILSVELEIAQEGFKQLQAEPRVYVPAAVRVEDQTFPRAEVHLKGHGSFQPITGKPNFMVRLAPDTDSQRPFGHKRLLLDNSSQDPSFLRWKLASELFLKAGLPAARVNFARVKLNGRELGLYLTIEPTDKPFLAQHFESAAGNLYEGSNTDVEKKLEQQSGDPDPEQPDLRSLAGACREADLPRRWNELEARLEVNGFASFMALEVLVCHHDGYSLDRNNYRIYHDPITQRMVFIPHGMDLIFDRAELPLAGKGWRGTVARAFMETSQGRQLYRQRATELAKLVYGSPDLIHRLDSLAGFLRTHLAEDGEGKQLDAAIGELRQVLEHRSTFILSQKSLSGP